MRREGGCGPAAVPPVVTIVASSDVTSLLDLPVESWIAELPRVDRTGLAGRTGFLR